MCIWVGAQDDQDTMHKNNLKLKAALKKADAS